MEIEPPATEAAAALRPSAVPEDALPQADEELGQEERSLPRPKRAPTVKLDTEGEEALISTLQLESRARMGELVRRSSPSSPVPRYSLTYGPIAEPGGRRVLPDGGGREGGAPAAPLGHE